MSKWVGYAVSVNCGEPLGCYQGTILVADGNTITLTKAFRNGFPYPKSQVTLNAADIKELKIIEARAEPTEQTHSTVAVSKQNKRAPRATVCENLQANPSSSGNQSHNNNTSNSNKQSAARNNQAPARSKPIDIQGQRPGKNTNHAGSYGQGGSTPKVRGGNMRRRDEACFGDTADPAFDRDFDFEGNLALFDKRALWEQMNNQKPDLVRQTDEAGKFRHDENVLGGGGGGAVRRAIEVPAALRGPLAYVSDEGAAVPSLTPRARQQLWAALERLDLADTARTLLARAAADVCVRVLGGGRRLEPRNAHQAPRVAVLAAAHRTGAAALTAARLLRAHGATVTAYLHPPTAAESCDDRLSRELRALSLSEVPLCARLPRLPRPDLLLLALRDPQQHYDHTQYESVMTWANRAVGALGARAAGVAMEGLGGEAAGGAGGWRACVTALLPDGECGGAGAGAGGRLYLADVGAPARVFAELGVRYRPPFGAAPLLALHPKAD